MPQTVVDWYSVGFEVTEHGVVWVVRDGSGRVVEATWDRQDAEGIAESRNEALAA